MRAARLAGVLQNMAPLKVMLTEHYHVTGEWPASVEELGLEPDRLHARGIEKIELLPGGGIRATFPPTSAPDARSTLCRPNRWMGFRCAGTAGPICRAN